MQRPWALRAAVVAAFVVTLAAPVASAGPSFVIVGDVDIGGFRRSDRVKEAIKIFGPPASRQENYETCFLAWPKIGVTMKVYYPEAARDPCGPEAKHVYTTVTDRRWRTSEGLRIGDPLRRLHALYPRAKRDLNGVWYLKIRWFGVALPGLETKVKGGRVVSLTVYGPRGF